MSTWNISFSHPIGVNLNLFDSEISPTKERVIECIDNSETPRYDKLLAIKSLYNLTVPWIVTENSPIYLYSKLPDIGYVSITIKKDS